MSPKLHTEELVMVFALRLLVKNQPWGPPRIWMGPDRTVGHGPDIAELLSKERQLEQV